MTRNKIKAALVAGLLAVAASSPAAEQTLPTPPPSDYADTESSVNVPLPDWPDLGRRVKLTLAANVMPSNCVQVAFGQDTNGDENLEPEETQLVLGIDCGIPFTRDEVKVRGEGERWKVQVSSVEAEQEGDHLRSPSTFTFTFRQRQAVESRFTHAKITTRGCGNSAAEIAAEITRPGAVLFLR